MKRSEYHDRDYEFGQRMLILRIAIGFTQAALADYLGVSRFAVGAWEVGNTYPKVTHLKSFIDLTLRSGAFAKGREAEEIRSLWRAARQKARLDESWLAALLASTGMTTDTMPSAPPSPDAEQMRMADEPVSLLRLPLQSTALVGRDRELSEINALLSNPACRLLTLVGPGGIGKTRLALEVATRHAGDYHDGVKYVDLASVVTVTEMVSAIGNALNLSLTYQSDPTDQILAYLRERHMLIVLDSFEHLLEGTELLGDILRHSLRTTLLVTSSARLNLHVEWLFNVEGLSYPSQETLSIAGKQTPADLLAYSAIQLFMQCARQVQADLFLYESTLASMARICQQVDGMPLAIELAAAGLRSLPIAKIEEQIHQNLDLLATTLRDVPTRHRSLRAVFNHSWNLLSEPEQTLLSRLAVFRGSFSLEGAEKVAGATRTLLSELIDKSLLCMANPATGAGSVSEPRFLLLPPLRAYALEKLAGHDKLGSGQHEHAAYYLEVAEAVSARWDNPAGEIALEDLDQEHDNMRAALQWARDSGHSTLGLKLAASLWRFWRRSGYIHEGKGWLEEFLAIDPETSDAMALHARLRALNGAAWLATDQHDFDRAAQFFGEAKKLRKALGEAEDDTPLLVNAALHSRAVGEYRYATAILRDAIARLRALLDDRGPTTGNMGLALYCLALILREQGDYTGARTLFEEGITAFRAISNREGMAQGQLGLSDLARDHGDVAQIRAYCVPSLAILRESGTEWAIGFALNNLALASYLDGDLPQAFTHISESVALFRGIRNEGALAEVLTTLARIQHAQGDSAAARATLGEALKHAWSVGPSLMIAVALQELATVEGHHGEMVQAVRLLNASSTLRAQMGTPVRPVDQPAVEQLLATARSTLGANTFTSLWYEAGQQSLEQTVRSFPSAALDLPSYLTLDLSKSETFVALPTRALASHRVPRLDWGLAQEVPVLYGRAHELATMTHWVMVKQCRVVTLVGIGGIGKTSLVITFARQIASHFAAVVFRSLGDAPLLPTLLKQLIHSLAGQQIVVPANPSEKLALLVDLLRQERCLLILDNLETLLQVGTLEAQYLAGYEAYASLFKVLGETAHQSCLLLTTRERPIELAALEGPRASVRSLSLTGLPEEACGALIIDQELAGSSNDIAALAQRYDGNPLALKLVADPIRALFGGDIVAFLSEGNLFVGGIGQLLAQQISRASALEVALLTWLAFMREPVTLDQLRENLIGRDSRAEVLMALQALWRRNLIERGQANLTFTLQPVILEYMTEQLMTTVCQEIVEGEPRLVQSHALMQAYARDYTRHIQERLILTLLLKPLLVIYGDEEALARQLLSLLESWRELPFAEQGYGPGNVVNLLRLQRGELRRLNLARLALREVYWQGVEAQDSTLAHARVRENVFTETFGVVHAVAATVSGSYWAASGINGIVQVWRDEGRTTHLSISAHTKHVKTLAFSPNEQILATGSWDCTIKLWEMKSGSLVGLLAGHQGYVQDVAFSPDGSQLVSVGDDGTLRIWDTATGTLLKTVQAHSTSIHGTAWSRDGKWVATCGIDTLIRVWEVASDTCMQTYIGHTRNVCKVAFSPDGLMLASASYDRSVRIWDLTSGECIKLFDRHESTVLALAWHPNGRALASCSYDGTIRLWELERDSTPRILHGHGASINSIAFTASGTTLLSGSDDQTVRVWNVTNGWCVRVIEGYGLFFYGVIWSPDGRALLSANSDATLTVWNVADGSVRLTLRGHTHTVYGVAWSPDGRWLASNGFDQTLRLWDTMTGTFAWNGCGHTDAICEVEWSPDGQRLASCSEDHTVRLWRVEDGALLQTLIGHESSVAGVAWSPDGQYLASCGGGGTDGELFIWDTESGERVKLLVGHDTLVLRLAWSQDSNCIMSGSMTGAIHWWDVERGTILRRQQRHQGWIRSLSVSSDGSMLVSSGEDGVILLWDVAQAELVRTLGRDRPYERMDITGLNGITKAQRAALMALGAVEQVQ